MQTLQFPWGGTVEEISLGIAVDGDIDPSSIMRVTPAVVDKYFNVGAEIAVSVPSLCGCSNVSIRNNSAQDILIQNTNFVIDYAGIRRKCRCGN